MVSQFIWRKDFLLHGIYLEKTAASSLCFWLALLHSVSSFFFLYQSPSSALCTVFDSISSNIDEVLSINPSANVFVFGDFNVHHKDWLTYSGEIDGPGELCYNFSASDDLTQMVNFPTQIPDYDSHRPTLECISLFWHQYLFCNCFPSIGKFEFMLLSQFPLTFSQIHSGMPRFIT